MAKPTIRFKGYTEDWEQRKLGDSCKINGRIGFRGYTEKDIVTKEAGGVLTFSPTNIVDNKLTMECKNTYITREKYDESPEIKISNGDILFVKTGSTLGKSALVTGLKEDASINPQIVVMRVEKNTETFMSNILITNGVMKQVAAVKIGGAVPTMTETELKNFTYFAPAEKEEKKKIGDFFRTLDHLITLHQRKCEETKILKKYMLQKMFPQNGQKVPEIRFKGFTEDWEQRKFGDIVQTRRGLTYKPTDIEESGIRVLRSSNIDEDTFVYGVDDVFVNPYAVNIEPVRKNDILITSANGSSRLVGKHALIKKIPDGSAVHGGFMLLGRTKNYDFVNASMSSSWYTKFINVFAAGGNGAIGNLNKNDLDEQVILIPDDAEQIKIGEYFAALDNLITLHQRKYEELKNIKKFMLQNMFV